MIVLAVVACTSGSEPPGGTLDFEAQCADVWPSDDCASDDCTPLPVNEDYADAFLEVLQSESGWTDAQMADHVALRHIRHELAEQSSFHEITATIDIDWARFLFTRSAGAAGGEPDYDAIVAAFEAYADAPRLDPSARLQLSIADIRQEILDCESTHEVTLDLGGWCDPWYPTIAGDDDRGLRFDFFAEVDGDYVQLSTNAVTGEVDCRLYSQTID
jgi:hypothetical protein